MAMAGRRRSTQRLSSAQYDFNEGNAVGMNQGKRNSNHSKSLAQFTKGGPRSSAASPASITDGPQSRIDSRTETRTPGSPPQRGAADRESFATDSLSKSRSTLIEQGNRRETEREPTTTPRASQASPRRPSPLDEQSARASPRQPSPRPESAPATSRKRVQNEFPKFEPSKFEPMPVGQGAGKWVRIDPNGFADSRGGTSMKGSIIKKAQHGFEEQTEELRQRVLACHAAETANTSTKFAGFTDRFIRWQDGLAMKHCMSHANGEVSNEHKPGCKCPVCKPMNAALLPPAGQVALVEVGGAGKPPYLLQVESDGIMPRIDFLTTMTSQGRSSLKVRKDVADVMKKEMPLVPRGCEPAEKPPDRMQDSHGVGMVMQSDAADPATEGLELMQMHTGNKIKAAVPGERLNEKALGFDPIKFSEIVSPRNGRSYKSRIRATHHFEDCGGVGKNLVLPPSVKLGKPKRSYIDPKAKSEFSHGFSEFTQNHNKHMTPFFRYEGDLVKGRRSVSAPPVDFEDMGVSELVFNTARHRPVPNAEAQECYTPDAEDTASQIGGSTPPAPRSITPQHTPRSMTTPRSITPLDNTHTQQGTPRFTTHSLKSGGYTGVVEEPRTPRSPGTPRTPRGVNDAKELMGGAAGMPTRGTNRNGLKVGEKSAAAWNTGGRMTSCLEHVRNEEVMAAREHRLRSDKGFADKAREITSHNQDIRQLAGYIRGRLHHSESCQFSACLTSN